MKRKDTTFGRQTEARVRQYERLVKFLARHGSVHYIFAKLCQTKAADMVVSKVALRIAKRYPNSEVDCEGLVQTYTNARRQYRQFVREDMDAKFVSSIVDAPENQATLAQFLRSLDTLDSRIRTGLIKTWFHAAILNTIVRKARFLSDRRRNIEKPYLLDVIIAPFGQCNLQCRGCYTSGELSGKTASLNQVDYLIGQVKRQNVYHVLVIGKGEPFYDEQSRHILFEIAKRNPQIFFSVYSNGTNISERDIVKLKAVPNLIMVLSIDGPEAVNDWRRGEGVYRKLISTFKLMQRHGLFFGCISTVFNQNLAHVADPAFLEQMAALGCKMAYYSLFVPFGEQNWQDMMLTDSRRQEYFQRLRKLSASTPIPIIDIDSIEQDFGCMAKRGARIYIDGTTGKVSPCIRMPFSPESCNIYRPVCSNRLSEILDTDFFRGYRENGAASGTCADSLAGELFRFSTCADLPNAERERAKEHLNRCRMYRSTE